MFPHEFRRALNSIKAKKLEEATKKMTEETNAKQHENGNGLVEDMETTETSSSDSGSGSDNDEKVANAFAETGMIDNESTGVADIESIIPDGEMDKKNAEKILDKTK